LSCDSANSHGTDITASKTFPSLWFFAKSTNSIETKRIKGLKQYWNFTTCNI